MQQRHIEISGRALEVHTTSATPRICAAHTTDAFGGATAELLAETAGTSAACVTLPKGGAAIASFDTIVDELEAVRRELAAPPWIFWGMSGGGWLALAYAHRHPEGLAGIVVESACACFRARLGDPACMLSPMFPMWRERVAAVGRLDPHAHDEASDATGGEWHALEDVGELWCNAAGAALLVAPMPLDDAMKAAMPRLWQFDARPWIATLRLPTLVIAGSADPVVPLPRVREIHEAIAGSRFVVAEGGAHVPTAQKHPAIAPAVRDFV